MNRIAWFFRIMWACRISLLSGLAGVALFCAATPAQNLLDDLSADTSRLAAVWFWTLVFVSTICLWALPIHYGARMTLDDDGWILSRAQAKSLSITAAANLCANVRDQNRHVIRQFPRALGILPFFAIGFGLYYSSQTDVGTTGLEEGLRTHRQTIWLVVADVVAAILYLAIVVVRQPLANRIRQRASGNFVLTVVAFTSLVLTGGFFLAAYFMPAFIVGYFPRALLIAPLFGSLVLTFSWLQIWTHRYGFPFLAFIALVALCVTAWNASFHDLRQLKSVDGDGRLSIEEAIASWKVANGCDPHVPKCPHHPVVVAIDGGASRAAFTAATFIGGILDRVQPAKNEVATPARRIFALSGVSGGAFGAAVIQAAVADAQVAGAATAAPCKTAKPTWFGYIYAPGQDPHRSYRWQECLQSLTSGDFLSPTIVGLAFRDFFAPPGWIDDRAALLEQAWERHYREIVEDRPATFCKKDVVDETGLCRRIAHPKTFLADHPDRWMPLLVLNGTSVRTGRRILASDLKASPEILGSRPLFSQAFDLREVLSSPCPGAVKREFPGNEPRPGLGRVDNAYDINLRGTRDAVSMRINEQGVCGASAPRLDGPDVRLSTAALTSARFPLISPGGTLQMKADKDLEPFGDRVVDGGYFENSGLTTALEIVDALDKAGLQPILVSIANEPAESDRGVAVKRSKTAVRQLTQTTSAERAPLPDASAAVPQRPSTSPLAIAPDNGFFQRMFEFADTPLEGLYQTRAGHAFETEDRAESLSSDKDPQGRPATPALAAFFRLRVDQAPLLKEAPRADDIDRGYCRAIWDRQIQTRLSMAKVSMSWWLSALVQADLDAQKCSVDNQTAVALIIDEMRK